MIDTALAALWAARLAEDMEGGWDEVRAAILAAEPADVEQLIRTVRWMVQVECHARPDLQVAVLRRMADEADGRETSPPPPPSDLVELRTRVAGQVSPPESDAIALIADRDALMVLRNELLRRLERGSP
jgi:hypothetical protein